MANTLGMLIGAAIDRQDGNSGAKGAIIGYLTEGALKIALPIVATAGLAWAAKRYVRRAFGRTASPAAVQ